MVMVAAVCARLHRVLTTRTVANVNLIIFKCRYSFLSSYLQMRSLFICVLVASISFVHAQWALIAGGSKGIGYSIAEALAKRKYNLILIARHWDSLNSAKQKLESQYGVRVELISKDLSKENSATEIANWCIENKIQLKVLCNVAGYGGERDFPDVPLDTVRYMVRLNIESVMAMTYTLLPLLEKNAPSFILNVASMAGFAPIPVKNTYSATKSAVIFFCYSLKYQLRDKNISVSCLAPGPVFTKPSIIEDTKNKLGKFGEWLAVPPKDVGEAAVSGMLRKKLIIVPARLAKVTAFFVRLLPRRMVVAIYDRQERKRRK